MNASAATTACSRRPRSPGPRSSSAIARQPAATCCSGTRCYYFNEPLYPCNKREPGSGCPATGGFNRIHAILGESEQCIATHPSDLCVALAALDATVRITGPRGERAVPLVDFHLLPGDTPNIETVLEADEIITAVELPAPSALTRQSAYVKVRDRQSYAFALVSVACCLTLGEDGTVDDVCLALGGVAHKPWRATEAEEMLRGGPATREAFTRARRSDYSGRHRLRSQQFQDSAHSAHRHGRAPEGARARSARRRRSPMSTDTALAPLAPLIGTATRRVTGPLKVSGQATYAAEFSADFGDELAHAVLVTAAAARGRIASIDTIEAEAALGVVRVFTHRNAPDLPYEEPEKRPGVQPQVGDPLRPLQTEQIFFSGQTVAVVVAETLEQAEHAATLVRVTVDREEAETDLWVAKDRPEGDEKQDTPRASRPKKPAEDGEQTGRPSDVSVGDPEHAWEQADTKVDLTVEIRPLVNHPIEPHATIAKWEGNRLTVWDKNQFIDNARKKLALAFGIREQEVDLKVGALNQAKDRVEDALGVRESSVRVISPFVGGGFGSGLRTWPHTLLTAMVARELGRPVRLVLTRAQMFTSVGHRPHNIQRVRLACDTEGRLQSVIHEAWQETSVYEEYTMNLLNGTRMAYTTPNLKTVYRLVPLNVQTPTSMRAPGEASGAHALEVAMDALAYQAGIDPLELRLRNNATHDPYEGKPFSSKHLAEAYRLGAERIGWADRTPEPRSMRDGDGPDRAGDVVGVLSGQPLRGVGAGSPAAGRHRGDCDGIERHGTGYLRFDDAGGRRHAGATARKNPLLARRYRVPRGPGPRRLANDGVGRAGGEGGVRGRHRENHRAHGEKRPVAAARRGQGRRAAGARRARRAGRARAARGCHRPPRRAGRSDRHGVTGQEEAAGVRAPLVRVRLRACPRPRSDG